MKENIRKNSVIAIQSFVITTIVYALLVPVFFEMENNAFGEENFVDDGNGKTAYSQQLVETKECKSPCSSTAEMCIAMRA
ncbi:MAG TPA: hypothetical protein VEW92_11500 [Nitrososphaeraceae archaeon]|nr:hypothetical protein [Nitrososphaeraceae archaeon]